MLNLAISLLTISNLLNIPGSYTILFFTTSNFTFTTWHIHNWQSFPLWPSFIILTGAINISNCPLLFPSSISYTFQPGWLFLWCHIILPFNTGVGCHFLFKWTLFCQNTSVWPVHLGWPYLAWLIASLSYPNPITTTGLWSVKMTLSILTYPFRWYLGKLMVCLRPDAIHSKDLLKDYLSLTLHVASRIFFHSLHSFTCIKPVCITSNYMCSTTLIENQLILFILSERFSLFS